ncbi:MAG: hypothetical protein J0M17_09745 [Planctomycetes bacterium]|nr:hypothetical protein [Planctomycetota bacterium]
MKLLMIIERPPPKIVRTIGATVAWFESAHRRSAGDGAPTHFRKLLLDKRRYPAL